MYEEKYDNRCGQDAPTPPKMTEITDAENRIDRAIGELQERTDMFIEKVCAVLRAAAPNVKEVAEKSSTSTVRLALDINAFARRIEAINAKVIDAIERVEI